MAAIEIKSSAVARDSRAGTRVKVLYYILKRKGGVVKVWNMNSNP